MNAWFTTLYLIQTHFIFACEHGNWSEAKWKFLVPLFSNKIHEKY